jgi:hypothetical protein
VTRLKVGGRKRKKETSTPSEEVGSGKIKQEKTKAPHKKKRESIKWDIFS